MDAVAIGATTVSAADADRTFDALYAAHAGKALRLAAMLVGDVHRGEDIAAAAMVKVYRRWLRGGIEDFWPYLRVAVVNQLRSELRRDRASDIEVPEIAVDDVADLVDQRAELLDALAALPVRQRAAITLRFLEDLSERDVAALLRCPPGTVKSAVSRGLAALRVALGGEDDE